MPLLLLYEDRIDGDGNCGIRGRRGRIGGGVKERGTSCVRGDFGSDELLECGGGDGSGPLSRRVRLLLAVPDATEIGD